MYKCVHNCVNYQQRQQGRYPTDPLSLFLNVIILSTLSHQDFSASENFGGVEIFWGSNNLKVVEQWSKYEPLYGCVIPLVKGTAGEQYAE